MGVGPCQIRIHADILVPFQRRENALPGLKPRLVVFIRFSPAPLPFGGQLEDLFHLQRHSIGTGACLVGVMRQSVFDVGYHKTGLAIAYKIRQLGGDHRRTQQPAARQSQTGQDPDYRRKLRFIQTLYWFIQTLHCSDSTLPLLKTRFRSSGPYGGYSPPSHTMESHQSETSLKRHVKTIGFKETLARES